MKPFFERFRFIFPVFLHSFTTCALFAGMRCSVAAQDFSVSYTAAPGTGAVIFNICAEQMGVRLDRQAVVKLVRRTDQSAIWQTTDTTSKSVFNNVISGSYGVEVSAVGYIAVRLELEVMSSRTQTQADIVLHRDPTAINLDIAHTIMSPKARKEAKNAISLLKSGDYNIAQKHLAAAYELAPSSAEVNFLLGYLYFQKKDFGRAGTYLDTAANLNPSNGPTLTLLGRTHLEQKQYPEARSVLERAVLADPENWLPHNLLATAYFREKRYDKAYSEAQIALTKAQRSGGSVVASIQLVLGESLVGLGRNEEGVKALKVFVEQSPRHGMAAQVRVLIAELQQRSSASPSEKDSDTPETSVSVVDPLGVLPGPIPLLEAWRPPSIDDVKPALASGITCPSGKVVEEAGKRVQEMVQDLTRFAAVEDLFHQALDRFGLPIRTEVRKYDYVASILEPQPGTVFVDEYRTDKLTNGADPDQIASTGFAALALVFHPEMRRDFELSCEGLTDWHGQASWLVDFRQRADRPNRMHGYRVGDHVFPVDLRGRAWISADKFDIVRMEADLVKPMPEIQLLSEHQIVEYGPVPFPKKNTTLWLPKQAELYFSFRKHNYYRRHSFDHYMLFSVETEEKRTEPVSEPQRSNLP